MFKSPWEEREFYTTPYGKIALILTLAAVIAFFKILFLIWADIEHPWGWFALWFLIFGSWLGVFLFLRRRFRKAKEKKGEVTNE